MKEDINKLYKYLLASVESYLSEQGACGDSVGGESICGNIDCNYCWMARVVETIRKREVK
jgi:hypothetical protein